MKKLICMMMLMLGMASSASAQDVWREILKISREAKDNKELDIEARKVATFKYDVLSYMAMKVRDDVLKDTTDLENFNITARMLNEQSYALYDFVNNFISRLSAAKSKSDKDIIITVFRNASLNHPFYNDMDKDLVLSYINHEGYITQFSLDTDWVKALEEVKKRNW